MAVSKLVDTAIFILLFSVPSLPTIHSALAKFFFNSKKLVILSHPVCARRCAGFNLPGIHADCNVCNRSLPFHPNDD